MDFLDEGEFGAPCANVVVNGASLSLGLPSHGGKLTGATSTDGNTVSATWTSRSHPQGLPLVLMRQASAIEPPKAVPPDPARPPVDIAGLQAVMDADLATALASGDLAPATGGGVTIGVVSHGVRKLLSYGAVKPDSVFEIGSITKTFTGLILAQMVEQKKVRLDEPVRALLPAGTVAAPALGGEITLVDLSTHRGGLPAWPDNMKSFDVDPHNLDDYDEKALYAFVASHGVALPPKQEVNYSNVGVGLLGQALANRAGMKYEALLHGEVTGPLGMRETVITIPPAMRARFVPGHDVAHKPAPAWDNNGALAGAGGIRSTAADMLNYLEAQLHPDHLPPTARATAEGKTLAAAIPASHVVQADAGDGTHIALNWFRVDAQGSFWHNGGSQGYSACVVFNPEKNFAVVVLHNEAAEGDFFMDRVGWHVVQRLTGLPAVSLAPATP